MFLEILTQLNLNISVVYHFFLFIFAWLFLQAAFFKPLLSHLNKREEKTTLFADQIREMKIKLQDRKEEYQGAKSQVYQESAEVLLQFRKKATQTYQEGATKGRADAMLQLAKGREKLLKKHEALSKELILHLNETKSHLKYLLG